MTIIKLLNNQKIINNEIEKIFNETEKGKNIIIIPAVVLFEIGYLSQKGRINISIQEVKNKLENSYNYVFEPLSLEIIEASFEIEDIKELHDKLIAGTARFLKLFILTNDPVIKKSRFVNSI